MQAKRTGIRVRHAVRCSSRSGRRCNCNVTYEAWVYSRRDHKKLYRSFDSLQAALAWRAAAQTALERGTLRAPTQITFDQAADAFLEGARAGAIRNRSGRPYKPSAVRSYERSLRLRGRPEFGPHKLSDIHRSDLQDWVDRLQAAGLDPSTIRNTLDPVRAIFRRAVARDQVPVNPTSGLEVPAARGRRERIAAPVEAKALLAALPDVDRALWATAVYAGLRRGELRALRWSDVDFEANRINVARGWDDEDGEIDGKTDAARRSVPLTAILRPELAALKLRTGRAGDGLVFGSTPVRAFVPSTVRRRALAAWKRAELSPIQLHECRHTFASTMIAAGVNAKALSEIMGHASITMTYDLYGHLMPGGEDEAGARFDAYLARAFGDTRT